MLRFNHMEITVPRGFCPRHGSEFRRLLPSRKLASCLAFQTDHAGMEIRDLGILDLTETRTRAFYVRYLCLCGSTSSK